MITKEQLIEIYKTCVDPELNIDIWTLGLIYNSDITEDKVRVLMTLTSPFCPYGPLIIDELKEKIEKTGVKEVLIEITFEPLWEPSQELRDMLGM